MPHAAAFALASSLATLVETLVFNTLTVWRTRVQAGGKRSRAAWLHAIPLQLLCLVARRPLTLVLSLHLATLGIHPFLAGCVAGVIEGVVFTPTRRLSTVQLASPVGTRAAGILKKIVAEEGWGGLWMGWRVNAIRTALGAGTYFSAVASAQAALPGAGHLVQGAIGSAAATLVLNPFEVVLATRYVRQETPPTLNALARGLALSLARNVPGGALRWWLTQLGAAWLCGL